MKTYLTPNGTRVPFVDCQALFPTFGAYLNNLTVTNRPFQAFNRSLFKIVSRGIDYSLWGNMCSFQLYPLAFTILACIPIVLAYMSMFWKVYHGIDVTQKSVINSSGVLWTIFRGYHTHFVKHYALNLAVDVYFSVAVTMQMGSVFDAVQVRV